MAAIPIATIPAPGEARFSAAPILVGLLGIACIVLAWFAVNRESDVHALPGASPPIARTALAEHEAGPASPLPGLQQGVAAVVAKATHDASPAALAPAIETAVTGTLVAEASVAALPAASSHEVELPIIAALAEDAAQPVAWPTAGPSVPAAAVAMVSAPEPDSAAAVLAGPVHHAPAPAPAPAPVSMPSTRAGITLQEEAAAGAAPAVVPAAASAVAPVTNTNTDPLQLFREAEAVVLGVTAYLGAGGPEPAWLDMPTGLEAAGIRSQLQARHGGRARPRMDLESPNWTLGSQAASALGGYRLGDRRGIVETGVLRVELIRLGSEWRVAGLQLEPAR